MFGWRRASKCKKVIRRAVKQLKMLKQKRFSIVRQLREDLAELINNGYEQIAFNRVEQLVKDETLLEGYELIESFCEFILVNLSYIRKNKNYPEPDDITEAISSLVFASARCGDFPQLKRVREFFGKLYGQSFVMAAVDTWPGNFVNPQIKEKLSKKAVSKHEKQRLINEITRECFHQAILALEYCPDWHHKQEQLVNGSGTAIRSEEEPGKLPQELEIIESKELVESCNDSELASSSLSSVSRWKAATLEDRSDSSSSERWPPFSDDATVYLDDIVELQNNSTTKDGELQDHRLFKFKSPVVKNGYEQSFMDSDSDFDDFEVVISDQKIVHPHLVCSPAHHKDLVIWSGDSAKKRRSCEIESMEYDVFIYSHHQPEDELSLGYYDVENDSPEYRKAAELALEWSRDGENDECLLLHNYPSHVHPKLPDYDEVVAKFMAVKREHFENKYHKS